MYCKAKDGKLLVYPYSIPMLMADNKNISFPKGMSATDLAAFDVFEVKIDDPPEVDRRSQRVDTLDQPELIDGAWVLKYEIIEKSDDEIAEYDAAKANAMRGKRNNLLAETDWTQTVDAPVNQAAWAVYRQALRDITEQEGFPHNIQWPVSPLDQA